jgi:ankyrin repeat protein
LLQRAISSKASGVFLWVALVIPVIAKQYNEGRALEKILEALEIVPSDLDTIYKHILTLVDPALRNQTLHLMQWICLAERPLSLTELRFALASDDLSIHQFQESAEESTGFVESDMRMKDMTIGLSGGLAEVKLHRYKHIVQFIHQSVNDFLLKYGFRWLDQNSAGDAIGRGHGRLSRSCINYLKLGQVQSYANSLDSGVVRLGWFAPIPYPFLKYATKSWFLHAEKAERWDNSQRNLIQLFQWPSAQYFHQWIKIFRGIDEYNSRCPLTQTTLMHLAAASNLESIVKALLESETSLEAEDDRGNKALHYAAHWGHKKIVSILLVAGADIDARDAAWRTPLEYAAAGGHEAVVKLLLEKGAKVNCQTGKSRGALQSAIFKGSWRAIRLLLDKGADVNAQGGQYGNALQAAAFCGSEKVAKLLLDQGADIHAQGGDYGNALQAAALSGSEAVVKLLLGQGADIHAQGGEYGNTLQAAAFSGSEAVVKLLLDQGADINAQGGMFDDVLQAAEWNMMERKAIIKLLCDKRANSIPK